MLACHHVPRYGLILQWEYKLRMLSVLFVSEHSVVSVAQAGRCASRHECSSWCPIDGSQTEGVVYLCLLEQYIWPRFLRKCLCYASWWQSQPHSGKVHGWLPIFQVSAVMPRWAPMGIIDARCFSWLCKFASSRYTAQPCHVPGRPPDQAQWPARSRRSPLRCYRVPAESQRRRSD